MYDDNAFAEMVKKKGIKLTAICNALGISMQSLRNRRKGKCKWTVDDMFNMAKVFGVSYTDILGLFSAAKVD